MRYVPRGHLKTPSITHLIVSSDNLRTDNCRNNLYVNMSNHKDEMGKVFFKEKWHIKVDLAYIVGSDIYTQNLNRLRSYLLDMYYVVNRYLTDSDLGKIVSSVFGGTKHAWTQWFSCDMVKADRFSYKHVITLKAFRYILKSPRLKNCINTKHQKWFTEKRINLSEVENVFI